MVEMFLCPHNCGEANPTVEDQSVAFFAELTAAAALSARPPDVTVTLKLGPPRRGRSALLAHKDLRPRSAAGAYQLAGDAPGLREAFVRRRAKNKG